MVLQVLGEFLQLRDLPKGLVNGIHVPYVRAVHDSMLAGLGNQADAVSN